MNYLVTVSMPIYNVEPYVEKALLSALNQSFDSIEFLIVDDKGSDKSMDIVRSIIETHPRGKDVRIIEHNQNIGLGAGRNTAIENATGRYIYFMDSDDEIYPDCIQILYNKMQEKPVDFVEPSVIKKDRNGNILGKDLYENKYITGENNIAYTYYNTKERHYHVWNKLYNLSFLKIHNIRCFPSHLNEDNVFTFQVVLNALSCLYIRDITYCYYDTPNSIVNDTKNNKVSVRFAKQYIESINFKKEYIQKYNDSKTKESIYRYIIFQTIYYASTINRSSLLSKKEKKRFLKELIKFPIKFHEIKRLKSKAFFTIMYLVYKLPFTLINFKIINYISSKK